MAYHHFDYTLTSEFARTQRRFLRELKRQEEEARRAAAPEAPVPFCKLFKIAPVPLVRP